MIIAGSSNNNIISGNICKDNDVDNTASSDGMNIQTSDYNVINGNRCVGNDRYGINIFNAAADNNIVVSNQLEDNTAGGLNDAGTGTEIGHNLE